VKGARPLSAEEIKKMYSAFEGKYRVRNQTLFLLGINTGFRISELLSVRVGDILEPDGSIKKYLAVSKNKMKRKRKGRTVVLNDKVKEALSRLLAHIDLGGIMSRDDAVFASQDSVVAIGRKHAWRILTAAFLNAKIVGKLGTHTLRKTFAHNVHSWATEKLARGETIDPILVTMNALGHSDPKATIRYLAIEDDIVDEAVFAIAA